MALLAAKLPKSKEIIVSLLRVIARSVSEAAQTALRCATKSRPVSTHCHQRNIRSGANPALGVDRHGGLAAAEGG